VTRATGVLAVCGLAWTAAVAAGFTQLYRYKAEPALQGVAPRRWPTTSALLLAPDRPTLVLFAHPACPCTRATVSELARLSARVSTRVAVRIVVVQPPDAPAEWRGSELEARAAAIPGAMVVHDDGREAALFEAEASGLVLAYDARGTQLFAGGITSARGHEGDSFGRRRLLAALAGETPDRATSPVFGCALAAYHGRSTEDGTP